MVQPIDQGSVLRSGMSLVPDYAAQELDRRQVAMQERQLGLEAQRQQQILAKAQREQQQAVEFQNAMDGYLVERDPQLRAQRRASLFARFPEFRQQLGDAFTSLDEPAKQSNLRAMSNIYGALSNGKPELAAEELRRRIEAEKAQSGMADPQDEAILGMIESGDPLQVNAAAGMVEVALDAMTDGKLSRLSPTTDEKVFRFNARTMGEPYAVAAKRVADDKFLAGPDGVYTASTATSGLPMPGPISGYGGGTFNMDGTQATPVNQGMEGGDPASTGAGAIPPPPPGFQLEGSQRMSADSPELDEAASIMGLAVNQGFISRTDWNRLNMMLPPAGRERLQSWLSMNKLGVR
jgi:hypothetical protein